MSVVWAMTSPEPGRFTAVERRSDISDLSVRFSQLRARGHGYLEVRLPGSDYPLLTLGFRGDHAVVHLFRDAERASLLMGDGTAPSDAVVDIPSIDGLAAFAGNFVLNIDRAWPLVRKFIQARRPTIWAGGVRCSRGLVRQGRGPRSLAMGVGVGADVAGARATRHLRTHLTGSHGRTDESHRRGALTGDHGHDPAVSQLVPYGRGVVCLVTRDALGSPSRTTRRPLRAAVDEVEGPGDVVDVGRGHDDVQRGASAVADRVMLAPRFPPSDR